MKKSSRRVFPISIVADKVKKHAVSTYFLAIVAYADLIAFYAFAFRTQSNCSWVWEKGIRLSCDRADSPHDVQQGRSNFYERCPKCMRSGTSCSCRNCLYKQSKDSSNPLRSCNHFLLPETLFSKPNRLFRCIISSGARTSGISYCPNLYKRSKGIHQSKGSAKLERKACIRHIRRPSTLPNGR